MAMAMTGGRIPDVRTRRAVRTVMMHIDTWSGGGGASARRGPCWVAGSGVASAAAVGAPANNWPKLPTHSRANWTLCAARSDAAARPS
jgi:hypothetical protein